MTAPSPALPPALAPLHHLPGVDVAAGLLSVAGKVQSYVRVLRLFAQGGEAEMAALPGWLEAGRLEEIRGFAHAQKGTAATLGLLALRDAALALEMAVRTGQAPEAIRQAMLGLIACRQQLIPALQAALATLAEAPLPAAGGANLQAVIAHLGGLLSERNFAATRYLREHAGMLRAADPAHYEDLAMRVGRFDFAGALDVLSAFSASPDQVGPA